MISLCLVEDQSLVREGLRSLLHLTEDIRVTGQAVDGIEALEVLSADRPDVVLLDLRMPRLDGLGVLRELGRRGGDAPPVIILTTFDDDDAILEGLRLGARGYLLKDVSFETLTEAVRIVAAGGSMINPVVTERLMRGISRTARTAPEAPLENLTRRELEVVRLMAAGLSNAEIADALRLSEGTVKNHVSSILGKLNARDRVRAILKSIELGLI
jgi:DNA-binding NarL/FixJ family response regulator